MKIPAHILQQGGVVPIQPNAPDIGATAQLITQAASMPVDSGVDSIYRFSALQAQRLAQQRTLDLKERMFEAEMDLKPLEYELAKKKLDLLENQIDLDREELNWKKDIYPKNLKLQQGQLELSQNQLKFQQFKSALEEFGELDTGATIPGVGGKTAGGYSYGPKTAAQHEALRQYNANIMGLTDDMVQAYQDNDFAAVMKLKNQAAEMANDPSLVKAIRQMNDIAYQIEQLKNDEDGVYDHTYAMRYLSRIDDLSLNEPVNLLIQDTKSLISEIVENNSEAFGLPELFGDYINGPYAVIQRGVDNRENIKKLLKLDNKGAYKARYDLQLKLGNKNLIDEQTGRVMSYEEWKNRTVDAEVNAIYYDRIEVNTSKISESATVNNDDAFPPGYNNGDIGTGLPGSQVPNVLVDNEAMLSEKTYFSPFSNNVKSHFITFDEFPKALPGQTQTEGVYEGFELTDQQSADSTKKLLRAGFRMFKDRSADEYVEGDYIAKTDNDTWVLTSDGADIINKLNKFRKQTSAIAVDYVPYKKEQVEELNENYRIGDNKDNLLNFLPGDDQWFMDVDPDSDTYGYVYDKEEFKEAFKYGGDAKYKVAITGQFGSNNPFAALAAQSDHTKLGDPGLFGVVPFHVSVTGRNEKDKAVDRNFVMTRPRNYIMANPNLKGASDIYTASQMSGGGEGIIPIGDKLKTSLKQLLAPLAQYDEELRQDGGLDNIVDMVVGITNTGESTVNDGPTTFRVRGNPAIEVDNNGVHGVLSANDMSQGGKLLILAREMTNSLPQNAQFNVKQEQLSMGIQYYRISYDGGKEVIALGTDEQNRMMQLREIAKYDRSTAFMLNQNSMTIQQALDNYNDLRPKGQINESSANRMDLGFNTDDLIGDMTEGDSSIFQTALPPVDSVESPLEALGIPNDTSDQSMEPVNVEVGLSDALGTSEAIDRSYEVTDNSGRYDTPLGDDEYDYNKNIKLGSQDLVVTLLPDDRQNLDGSYGNLKAMKGVKRSVDSNGNVIRPKLIFNREFWNADYGFPKFDMMLNEYNRRNSKAIKYLITDAWRPGSSSAHGRGMAVDIRAKRWNDPIVKYLNKIIPDFKPTKSAIFSNKLNYYRIPGTKLVVAMHKVPNNEWHLHMVLRPGLTLD